MNIFVQFCKPYRDKNNYVIFTLNSFVFIYIIVFNYTIKRSKPNCNMETNIRRTRFVIFCHFVRYQMHVVISEFAHYES